MSLSLYVPQIPANYNSLPNYYTISFFFCSFRVMCDASDARTSVLYLFLCISAGQHERVETPSHRGRPGDDARPHTRNLVNHYYYYYLYNTLAGILCFFFVYSTYYSALLLLLLLLLLLIYSGNHLGTVLEPCDDAVVLLLLLGMYLLFLK